MTKWVAMALVLALGCGSREGAGPGQTSLVLNWFPEHEHGGYFAALAGGDYTKAGLDVRIVPGGPGVTVVPRVASGEMQFGVTNADEVVQARAAGAPVVALMAPIQHSPFCVMVHARSGVERLEDLRDLTLAMTPGTPYLAWLEKTVPLTNVRIVPYGGNVAQFLVEPNYAQQAYLISEPVIAAEKGGDPRCLPLSAIGFDPYTSVLVASEATVRDHPERVRAMVEASVRGWRRYVDDPAAANAEILKRNPEIGRNTLEKGHDLLVPLIVDETARAKGIGVMTPERWGTLADQLRTLGMIERPVDATTLYDARFTPAAGD